MAYTSAAMFRVNTFLAVLIVTIVASIAALTIVRVATNPVTLAGLAAEQAAAGE